MTTIPMPVQISDATLAFPARAPEFMPQWDDIPDDFKNRTAASEEWHALANHWFAYGLASNYTGLLFNEIDGKVLDGDTVTRQISAILGSFAPKHEHKMASVAWLLSLWVNSCVYGAEGCAVEDLKIVGDWGNEGFSFGEWIAYVDGGRVDS